MFESERSLLARARERARHRRRRYALCAVVVIGAALGAVAALTHGGSRKPAVKATTPATAAERQRVMVAQLQRAENTELRVRLKKLGP
jgi:hypothetical protein